MTVEVLGKFFCAASIVRTDTDDASIGPQDLVKYTEETCQTKCAAASNA